MNLFFIFLIFYSSTDVNAVVDEIMKKEPLITASKVEQVHKLVIHILPSI